MNLCRAAAAEAIGTALLLSIVVGSGIMGERLSSGNAAVALLANAIATGAGLYVLIVMLAPISGAHFNPIVSAVSAWEGRMAFRYCGFYLLAQIGGAFSGVIAAHAMFGLPLLQRSAHLRPTLGEGLGETIATFGLILVILLLSRFRPAAIPVAVAAFITSAYWFTSSTSFANPAVTVARAATDTFAGISPQSVPIFVVGQVLGGGSATLFARWLLRHPRSEPVRNKVMKSLGIVWQRLVNSSGETCDRCGTTYESLQQAVAKLKRALAPLGVEPSLKIKEIDATTFQTDPSASNRVWIADHPLEEWLGAKVGSSRCCSVCGDADCRTVELGGVVYESIPEDLIVRAALSAVAQLLATTADARPSRLQNDSSKCCSDKK